MNNSQEYIYPKINKTCIEEEKFKTYIFSSYVRVPVEGIYHKVLLKKQTVINKEIHTSLTHELQILELMESFNVEVYRLLNFYADSSFTYTDMVDKDQTSEKDRLKIYE